MPRCGYVLRSVQEPRLGTIAVASRAAELLVVGVERSRRVGVEHPTYVGLIDAHPERDRGRNDPRRALEELTHRTASRARGQPGVVQRHTLASRRQRVPRGLRAGVGCGVHDPRARELVHGPSDQPLLVVARGRVHHR